MSEIKRMNAAKTTPVKEGGAAPAEVNTEVQALKKRIEEMHKNIDHLTAMVEKVNLKQEEKEREEKEQMELYGVGHKRKKIVVADPIPEPEPVASIPDMQEEEPMEVVSHMEDNDTAYQVAPLPPVLPLPDVSPVSHRELSNGSNSTDNEFVDQLFKQFGDDEVEFLHLDEPVDEVPDNRPDPELMQRLSDALMVLPKEIQEMIVERLIQSITSPDFLKNATTTPEPPVVEKPAERHLAAATLAALLQHLSQHASQHGDDDDNKPNKSISKFLPVVPVHA